MTTPAQSPQAPAFVRTLVPFLVAWVGAYLAKHGFGIDPVWLTTAVGLGLGYAWFVIVHVVELKVPQFGWLLGIAKAPAYSSEPAPSPGPDESVVAEVVPDPDAEGEMLRKPVKKAVKKAVKKVPHKK